MTETERERIARLEERVASLVEKVRAREKREWALLVAVLGMASQYIMGLIQ